jgi:hypothetical protein
MRIIVSYENYFNYWRGRSKLSMLIHIFINLKRDLHLVVVSSAVCPCKQNQRNSNLIAPDIFQTKEKQLIEKLYTYSMLTICIEEASSLYKEISVTASYVVNVAYSTEPVRTIWFFKEQNYLTQVDSARYMKLLTKQLRVKCFILNPL